MDITLRPAMVGSAQKIEVTGHPTRKPFVTFRDDQGTDVEMNTRISLRLAPDEARAIAAALLDQAYVAEGD